MTTNINVIGASVKIGKELVQNNISDDRNVDVMVTIVLIGIFTIVTI